MNIESARKKDFFQEVTLLCKIKGDTMNATFKNQLTIVSGHEKDSIHIAVQQLFISSFSKFLQVLQHFDIKSMFIGGTIS